VDSLNEMFDAQTTRVAGLNNRVPNPIIVLEVAAATVALGLLAIYMSMLGRGVVTVVFASVLVTALLLVTFDLDRSTRGLITVPDAALKGVRAAMVPPPAATGPSSP
jgi:hypothetical protein